MVLALVAAITACGRAGPIPRASPEPHVLSDTSFFQEASWSPDGKVLLVSALGVEQGIDRYTYRIYRIGVDGSDFRALTDGPRDYWTSWSPDGSRIAFASERDENMDILVMNADGTGRLRLTDDPAKDTHPDWSPDGRRILFVSDRSGESEIFVMDADGSNQERIGEARGEVWNPVWSPAGDRVAFYQTEADGRDHVMIMRSDGGEARRIAAGVWPSFSLDGMRLLYGGEGGLTQINVDGTDERVLIAGDANFGTYSPDGSSIAYVATAAGVVSLNVAQVDGSERRILLTAPMPVW